MASFMKAAILTGPRSIEIREVPVPALDPNGFLIKVTASGVCGSDLRAWEEGIPGRGGIGHEVAGTIFKIGDQMPEDSPFKMGDHIIVAPTSCGVCQYCLSGNEHMCPHRTHAGFTGPGGFSEFLSIPHETVEKGAVYTVPKTMKPQVATLVEPFACVLNGQDKVDIRPGMSVAIIGGGPIGLLHAVVSRLRGAYPIFISDMNQKRLEMASWTNADFYINAKREDALETVLRHTRGEGVDCVIVACSSPKAHSSAINMVKRLGQVLLFSGLKRGQEEVSLNVQTIHRKEIVLKGSRNAQRRHFQLALYLLSDEHPSLEHLITHVFHLPDIELAFSLLAKGEAMKAVIVFT